MECRDTRNPHERSRSVPCPRHAESRPRPGCAPARLLDRDPPPGVTTCPGQGRSAAGLGPAIALERSQDAGGFRHVADRVLTVIARADCGLSLIHISEPTRRTPI